MEAYELTNKALSPKERILRQIRSEEVDCIPTIGGWIEGVKNLAKIGGIRVEAYLADPMAGVIRANRALAVDAMINPVVPQRIDEIRTGMVVDAPFQGIQPEAILAAAEALPDRETVILSSFDAHVEENRYRHYFERAFRSWEEIVPIPNFWEIGGHFPLYVDYGYQAFMMACALYPEAVGRIWYAKSLHSRERAKILVKLYREYDLVPLMFCGEDLCNNKGPMVSTAFLRKVYFPTVQMIITPLVEAGIRCIHHCDGDVRPVVDDFIRIGFSGLQGFQYELGVDLYELRQKRSLLGETLLFFTGLSVSRTLPFGTLEDVRDEIDYFIDATEGGQGMFLFTSNVAGIEVPPENLQFAYRYVRGNDWKRKREKKWHEWPWLFKAI
jgi:hypothetical protein